MSIEKLSDCSKTILQRNPFTQICNEVIVHIKDNDAFRVYAFLQSKSQEWRVIKDYVGKICGIGMRKIDYIFSYLKRCNLIRYVNTINEKGKFVKVDIQVLNGLEFDSNISFHSNKEQNIELSTGEITTPALSAGARNRGRGNAQLLNKDITKEREKQKESFQKDQKPISPPVQVQTKKPEPYKPKPLVKKEVSTVDVTKQSTSYNPEQSEPVSSSPEAYEAAMKLRPNFLRPQKYRDAAVKLPTRTDVQSEVAAAEHIGVQGVDDAHGRKSCHTPPLRGTDGFMEIGGSCAYSQAAGLAGGEARCGA